MTIKQIEFTHDIEKPHLSPSIKTSNNKNSLKKSKTLDRFFINNSENDRPDLIRKKLSSDDDQYQIRKQNSATINDREQIYSGNQHLTIDAMQKQKEPNKIPDQNGQSQPVNLLPNENVNNRRRPLPQSRNVCLPKRRPIPIVSHPKQNDSKNNIDPNHSPKFRPQPPGSPKSPILPPSPHINRQIRNDSLIQVKNLNFDDYDSYSSYADSIDTDYSLSSENNLNLSNNNNTKSSKDSNPDSDVNNNHDESNIDQNSNMNQISNSNSSNAQLINSETTTTPTPIIKSIKEKYFYRMEKSTIARIPKKKKKFTFFLGNKALVEVKYTKKQKNIQFNAFDANSQTEKTYTLLIGNRKSSFSLRNGSIYDNEIFSLKIVDERKPFHYYSVILNSFVNIENFPNKLVNKEPSCDLESPESPGIIFGQRSNSIIPSKSNWIYYSPENEELIAVMKGSKSIVFIESIPSVITPILFTIALAAFIGNPN